MKERYLTKKIYVGDVAIGGDAPISVQSMTYSDTHNVAATVEQINRLHFAGADMVRVAVPDMEDALALKRLKSRSLCRLLQIFILTINWHLKQQSGWTAFVLTPGISVKSHASKR